MYTIAVRLPYYPSRNAALAALAFLGLCVAVPLMQAQSAQPSPAPTRSETRAESSTSLTREKRQQQRFLMRVHASSARELQLSQLASSRAANPQVRAFAQQIVTEHQQFEQELRPLLTAAGLDITMLSINAPADRSSSSSSSSASISTPTSPAPASSSNSSASRGSDIASSSSSTAPSNGSSSSSAPSASSSSASAPDTVGAGSSYSGMTSNSGIGANDSNAKPSSSTAVANPTLKDRWSSMLDDRRQKKLTTKTGADFDKAYVNFMVDEHEDAVDQFEDAIEDNDAELQSFASKHLAKLRQQLSQAEQLEKVVD